MNRFILMSLAVTAVAFSCLQHAAFSALLSPTDFPATSAFSSSPGTYTVNTDTFAMTGPMGFSVGGVLSQGIAVFTFADFSLGAGANIVTIGTRPSAILSHTDLTIGGGGIRALAGGGQGGEPGIRGDGPGGGFPGFGFFGGAGGGGGFGGAGGRGKLGNATFDFPGAGGPAYGDLSVALEGGSGGGGGKSQPSFQSAGGNGGGGLELGALGLLLIDASINADGSDGVPRGANHAGGGGGSGGGLRLHARSIIHNALVSARGGAGGDGVFDNGGGGGGGRIRIDVGTGGLSGSGSFNVAGGIAPSDFFGRGINGQPGVLSIHQVPEPSTIVSLIAMASWAMFGGYRPLSSRRPHR